MHLAGYIIRIYHNARSPKRQINVSLYSVKHHIMKECVGMEVWLHVLFLLDLDSGE